MRGNKDKPIEIMLIASFGGHWIQLSKLIHLFEGQEVLFVSTSNLVKKKSNSQTVYDCSKKNIFKTILCFLQLLFIILKNRPKVILSTGAAPGALAIIIGKILGKKTIWLDSLANFKKISLSGRLSLPFTDLFFTQWEHLSNEKILYKGSLF